MNHLVWTGRFSYTVLSGVQVWEEVGVEGWTGFSFPGTVWEGQVEF